MLACPAAPEQPSQIPLLYGDSRNRGFEQTEPLLGPSYKPRQGYSLYLFILLIPISLILIGIVLYFLLLPYSVPVAPTYPDAPEPSIPDSEPLPSPSNPNTDPESYGSLYDQCGQHYNTSMMVLCSMCAACCVLIACVVNRISRTAVYSFTLQLLEKVPDALRNYVPREHVIFGEQWTRWKQYCMVFNYVLCWFFLEIMTYTLWPRCAALSPSQESFYYLITALAFVFHFIAGPPLLAAGFASALLKTCPGRGTYEEKERHVKKVFPISFMNKSSMFDALEEDESEHFQVWVFGEAEPEDFQSREVHPLWPDEHSF